jgi:glyoxylase-like metal-dependent hydrolase (beta-lactamase superfamily II)
MVDELPVAERWFVREELDSNVLRLTEPRTDPLIRANIYLIRGRDRHLLVDTGLGIASLAKELTDLLDHPATALVTHFHYDHSGSFHEFDDRVAHPADADALASDSPIATLLAARWPADIREGCATAGYPPPDVLIDALPYANYDPAEYRLVPVAPTRLVREGDVIDLGDRRLEVIHLPGHTPGCVGLWEAATEILFTGDALYDGPLGPRSLLDELPTSDISAYVRTIRRLREIPARVVHGGHHDSLDRKRLVELCDEYLAWRAPETSLG